MKHLLHLLAAVLLSLLPWACGDYASMEELNRLESRVAVLESLCNQMNTNISSLQTLVSAAQNGDYVTGVSPVTRNGETVGYTITFAKSPSITIYHGQDGSDGQSPRIGVRRDADNRYYWTLDGEWLLDASGKKIQAEGTGADGVTPRLRISGDYWEISYDGGAGWQRLGKAVGDAGDTMFRSVTLAEGEVRFELADGQRFSLPLQTAAALALEFEAGDLIALGADASRDIRYTVVSDAEDIAVEALGSGDLKVKVVPTDGKTGVLQILTGPALDYEYSRVVVLASDGVRTVMKTLTFEKEAIQVADEGTVPAVSPAGGELELKFLANTEYRVEIEEPARTWIHEKQTRALSEASVSLVIDRNEGSQRSGTVKIVSATAEDAFVSFTVQQKSPADFVVFEDDNFKAYCVENFDRDGDGEISLEEAQAVTKIDGGFEAYEISSLKGIEYFENLDTLWMENHYNLGVLDVSQNHSLKFLRCTGNSITELKLPDSLEELICQGCGLTELDVRNCPALWALVCPDNQLTDLDVSLNPELVQLSCKNNLLTRLDLSSNTSLRSLHCSGNKNLTELNIKGCEALYLINSPDCGLRSLDVSGCPALETLYCDRNYFTLLDVSNNLKLWRLKCQQDEPLTLWLKTGQEIEEFQYNEAVTTIERK